MTDHNHQFWSRLDDINSGMLGVTQDSRLVPMSHYTDRKVGVLWFITAKDTDLALLAVVRRMMRSAWSAMAAKALRPHPRHPVPVRQPRQAGRASGMPSPPAGSEDGKQDPDVQLLRVWTRPRRKVWATGGSMALPVQIAKSKITGDKPDMGDHYSLTF